MIYEVRVEDSTFEIEITSDLVRINGESVLVDLATLEKTNDYSLILDGVSQPIHAIKRGRGAWDILCNKRRFYVNVLDRLGRAIKAVELQESEVQHPEAIIAPMPGTIVSVEVEEGESVEAGQGLVIVEAMNMENEVRAQAGGCVQVIHVASGDAVEKGKILVELVPLEEEMI